MNEHETKPSEHHHQAPVTEHQVDEKSQGKQWYQKWWGIVLAILFFPVFGIWYIWAKSNWKTPLKILVTAVCGIIIISWLVQIQPTTKTNTSNQNQPTPATTNSTTSESAPTTASADSKPSVPAEYTSALYQATSYANDQHMSKQSVYDQLVSQYGEKFSVAAAQYAIDNVKADWNANALFTAKSYQTNQHMSPAAIHDQLTSQYGEKFTQAEADFAIQHLND
ncbi:MAG TPA: Ltp family lipoprotein [Candidatus Saccharimonadales bacterium]|nr:Ltp family lipoprotein [Candidatus Saccharimonadales bacterium]